MYDSVTPLLPPPPPIQPSAQHQFRQRLAVLLGVEPDERHILGAVADLVHKEKAEKG